jgi:uncharacterized membrane protein
MSSYHTSLGEKIVVLIAVPLFMLMLIGLFIAYRTIGSF